ncbi:MAG: L,D-transpeptidase [Alphaproteobacteria bacterium]|nr:L,D-transpeptidase [Alphaproteobacteria bacterium]
MSPATSRRQFLIGVIALWASGPARAQEAYDAAEGGYDPALLPPPESPVDFPVKRVAKGTVKKLFRRKLVNYDGPETPGTIVVDPANRFLCFVRDGGLAVRYGVGVGRAGFAWSGSARVGLKRRWPRWIPPREMVARDERARKWANGQPGGPENPLGARALYLYANGVDTLYRIHGTNDPSSIGKAMSSGCIRMLNEDIAELFPLVPVGTPVIVRGGRVISASAADGSDDPDNGGDQVYFPPGGDSDAGLY